MVHDVFVSYSNKDKAIANALCATLENKKIRCWIAPRDIVPGKNFAGALIEAINQSRIMVLVFSSNSNNSPQVMREVERAVHKGIPIIPLRIENVEPTKSMEYFLSAPHWLDALTPPLKKHLEKLAQTVNTLLVAEDKTPETRQSLDSISTKKRIGKKIKPIYVAFALIAILLITVSTIFATGGFANINGPTENPLTSPTPSPTITPTSSPSPISPSGSIISVENAAMVSQIELLDSDQGREIIWSPDGKWLAIANYHIDIYDGKTLEPIYTIETLQWPKHLVFSPNSSLLLAGDYEGLYGWNMDGFAQILSKPEVGSVESLAISPDGKTLATASGQAVKLWDMESWTVLYTLPAGSVTVVAFSPDGHTVAAGGGMAGTEIIVWNAESGQELYTLTGHTNLIQSITFSPDGQILASGSIDEKIWLWNINSGLQIRVLSGHTNHVTSLAFSPDGQILASASWDLTVRLWNVVNGQELNSLYGHSNWLYSVAFSPDGAIVASGGSDQEVRLWGLP